MARAHGVESRLDRGDVPRADARQLGGQILHRGHRGGLPVLAHGVGLVRERCVGDAKKRARCAISASVLLRSRSRSTTPSSRRARFQRRSRLGEEGQQLAHQALARQRLDVVLVQPVELAGVGLTRGALHLGQVEERAHLVAREDLLVAVRPADPHQPVAHRLGQVAGRAEVLHRHRIAALRELLAVGADDQRHMGEERWRASSAA